MSADAIAVFNPQDFEKLRPFLDLDEDSEESDGLYAEQLPDGSVLVHTFQPYEVFAENPAEVQEWLAQFGEALPFIHDDVRGLLFFPDDHEPTATTYDGVVAEMADKGIFVPLGDADMMENLDSLAAAAAQLLGGAPASGFEIGKLFQDVQKQLVDALGLELPGDDETKDAEPTSAGDDDASRPPKP